MSILPIVCILLYDNVSSMLKSLRLDAYFASPRFILCIRLWYFNFGDFQSSLNTASIHIVALFAIRSSLVTLLPMICVQSRDSFEVSAVGHGCWNGVHQN